MGSCPDTDVDPIVFVQTALKDRSRKLMLSPQPIKYKIKTELVSCVFPPIVFRSSSDSLWSYSESARSINALSYLLCRGKKRRGLTAFRHTWMDDPDGYLIESLEKRWRLPSADIMTAAKSVPQDEIQEVIVDMQDENFKPSGKFAHFWNFLPLSGTNHSQKN